MNLLLFWANFPILSRLFSCDIGITVYDSFGRIDLPLNWPAYMSTEAVTLSATFVYNSSFYLLFFPYSFGG